MLLTSGTGKTLISRALPRMSVEEALDVTKIYSVAGMLAQDRPLMNEPSFSTYLEL